MDRTWIADAENEVKKAKDHLNDLERRNTWSPATEAGLSVLYDR